MRNLILLIWRNNFFFLFLLLEVISISLVIRNNSFQRASFINSSNYLTGSILRSYSNITEYFHLRQSNRELAIENAVLHSLSKRSYINTSPGTKMVSDSVLRQKYEYVTAKVVGNSTNRRNNYITLDIGSNHGIKPDMGVISPHGVIGIVKDVSENFSSVISLLNEKTMISCKIKKNGSFGPLTWEGNDYTTATLKDIPTHIKLVKGDTVVTSSYSSTYPENILVGTVENFKILNGEHFYTIEVNLSSDFKNIDYVYIVKNIMKEEQDNLEKTSQKND